MKARFDGLFRDVETERGFGARHLLDGAQDEHRSEFIRESVDGAFQNSTQLLIVHFLFRATGRLERHERWFCGREIESSEPLLLAFTRERFVDGDASDSGREARFPTEARQMLV